MEDNQRQFDLLQNDDWQVNGGEGRWGKLINGSEFNTLG